MQEKLLKHKAALDKIQKHQEERKAQIAEAEKAYKEINKYKPLYLKVQERFEQETESIELAKQKKALEDKRNFVNQVPAGGFKNAFVEHEVSYRQMKEERESQIALKRLEEKSKLKNHYGQLKYKPNKDAIEAYDINSKLKQLAQSVDGKVPKESNNGNSNSSLIKQITTPEKGILHNKYLDEVKQKEYAKQK